MWREQPDVTVDVVDELAGVELEQRREQLQLVGVEQLELHLELLQLVERRR